MKIHRIAVVGCGAIARGWHCRNIAANPRAQLAVACDANIEAATACAQEFGAGRVSTDWHDVIDDEDVDVILLATHTNLRGDLIVPAVKVSKPVFVEKPLASSVDEMLTIARAVEDTGVPVCVNHNRRSSPAILDMKRLLDKALACKDVVPPSVDRLTERTHPSLPQERAIQMLIRVNDDSRSWKDWIFDDPQGILVAEMVHFIDIALWLNPSLPVRVFAEGAAMGNFSLMITFADGSITTMQHTMVGNFDSPKELFEVSANHVTIVLDHHVEVRQRGLADEPFRTTYALEHDGDRGGVDGIEGFHRAVSNEFKRAKKTAAPLSFISPNKGHAAHFDRFLDCVEGKGENPCDVRSAVAVTCVALKLLESIRAGVPVVIRHEDLHLQ